MRALTRLSAVLLGLAVIELLLVDFRALLQVLAGAAVALGTLGVGLFVHAATRARGDGGDVASLAESRRAVAYVGPAVMVIVAAVFAGSSPPIPRGPALPPPDEFIFEAADQPATTIAGKLALPETGSTAPSTAYTFAVGDKEGRFLVTPLNSDLVEVRPPERRPTQGQLRIVRASDAWVAWVDTAPPAFRKPGKLSGRYLLLGSVVIASSARARFSELHINLIPNEPLSAFTDSTEVQTTTPPRRVWYVRAGLRSHRSAFATRSVELTPLNASPSGEVSVSLADSSRLVGVLCPSNSDCPATEVEVRNLPRGSFYEAPNYVEAPKIETFETREAARWRIRDLRRGVGFSYVIQPLNSLHTLLAPGLWVATWGQLAWWLFGIIVMAGALVKPTVWVFTTFRRRPAAPTSPSKDG